AVLPYARRTHIVGGAAAQSTQGPLHAAVDGRDRCGAGCGWWCKLGQHGGESWRGNRLCDEPGLSVVLQVVYPTGRRHWRQGSRSGTSGRWTGAAWPRVVRAELFGLSRRGAIRIGRWSDPHWPRDAVELSGLPPAAPHWTGAHAGIPRV